LEVVLESLSESLSILVHILRHKVLLLPQLVTLVAISSRRLFWVLLLAQVLYEGVTIHSLLDIRVNLKVIQLGANFRERGLVHLHVPVNLFEKVIL
jgi:hypothetical protein